MPVTETLKAVTRPMVLVVDDDPAVLEALQSLLAPRLEPLYRVETAASAEEALELAGARSPEEAPIAAVISDEKMPGRSGTELLVALRQSRAHRHGGRMIITAYAGLESAKKAINEAEVDRYYPKPWDADGKLLPALAAILERFARDSGLDELQVAAVADYAKHREAILAVRRAWWEYIELMGLSAEEAGMEAPSFEDAHDAAATHVVVTRLSPRERRAVASIRLRASANDAAMLESLAFLPEEANEATETLLLRTALLHASRAGIKRIRADVPALRREVYEALGFAPVEAPAGPMPTISMETRSPEGAAGPGQAFARRYAAESRLCRCAQPGCPERDYNAARRGYFCPLDLTEGRVPEGFPVPAARG